MPEVSIIIPTMNESKRIGRIIGEVRKVHPSTEVVVVDNGSTDGTSSIAKALHAKVVRMKQPLGHDVGRAIGAAASTGRILLFIDGDMFIEEKALKPFITAIQNGVDIALNAHLGKVEKNPVHNVVLTKHAFNIFLNRAGMKGYSMTTIPHACSRQAVEKIGYESFMVPPLALAIAYMLGLRVEAVHHIPVGQLNPKKRAKVNGKDPLESLIIGDHLEALQKWIANRGDRGGFGDGVRRREKVDSS
ncbi:MAG: hypothetical protein RLZZ267_83 [Bacillota bacterium]|jgi:glycosyltransferase involved in cell wall biosynthesis